MNSTTKNRIPALTHPNCHFCDNRSIYGGLLERGGDKPLMTIKVCKIHAYGSAIWGYWVLNTGIQLRKFISLEKH